MIEAGLNGLPFPFRECVIPSLFRSPWWSDMEIELLTSIRAMLQCLIGFFCSVTFLHFVFEGFKVKK